MIHLVYASGHIFTDVSSSSESWVICKQSATVEAVHVGAAGDSRHTISRTEHQACGRSKNRKGEKKIIAILDFHPFNSSVRRVKCTGLN